MTVQLVTIRPRDDTRNEHTTIATHVDLVLQSFEEALAFVSPGKIG